MRQFLALAALLSLGGGAAHVQFQPIQPIAPIPPIGAPPKTEMFRPYKPPEPIKPFTGQSVYDDGPFSPAAEAKRARKAAAAQGGGMFSPEAEAKRERERAKAFHPY
jgi:hypothetical protein